MPVTLKDYRQKCEDGSGLYSRYMAGRMRELEESLRLISEYLENDEPEWAAQVMQYADAMGELEELQKILPAFNEDGAEKNGSEPLLP